MSSHTETFRNLLAPGNFLILANAWDAGSARIIELAGAPAIATTSAGVAWAAGYPDGDALPIGVLTGIVERIARVISVPLTVDMEGGYSDDPRTAAANVLTVARAGGIGINLEDGRGTPDLLCAKIAAIKEAAGKAGLDIFVNARTDVLLKRLVPAEGAMEETLARVARYKAAGADGIFVPMIKEPGDIATVATAIDPLPLNVMAMPGVAPAGELKALGARRLSAATGLSRAALAATKRLAAAFVKDGRSDALYAQADDLGNLNALFPKN